MPNPYSQYTGTRISPVPSGFLQATGQMASDMQKGLAGMGQQIGEGIAKYYEGKEEEKQVAMIRDFDKSFYDAITGQVTSPEVMRIFGAWHDKHSPDRKTQAEVFGRAVRLSELQSQKKLNDALIEKHGRSLAETPTDAQANWEYLLPLLEADGIPQKEQQRQRRKIFGSEKTTTPDTETTQITNWKFNQPGYLSAVADGSMSPAEYAKKRDQHFNLTEGTSSDLAKKMDSLKSQLDDGDITKDEYKRGLFNLTSSLDLAKTPTLSAGKETENRINKYGKIFGWNNEQIAEAQLRTDKALKDAPSKDPKVAQLESLIEQGLIDIKTPAGKQAALRMFGAAPVAEVQTMEYLSGKRPDSISEEQLFNSLAHITPSQADQKKALLEWALTDPNRDKDLSDADIFRIITLGQGITDKTKFKTYTDAIKGQPEDIVEQISSQMGIKSPKEVQKEGQEFDLITKNNEKAQLVIDDLEKKAAEKSWYDQVQAGKGVIDLGNGDRYIFSTPNSGYVEKGAASSATGAAGASAYRQNLATFLKIQEKHAALRKGEVPAHGQVGGMQGRPFKLDATSLTAQDMKELTTYSHALHGLAALMNLPVDNSQWLDYTNAIWVGTAEDGKWTGTKEITTPTVRPAGGAAPATGGAGTAPRVPMPSPRNSLIPARPRNP